MYEVVTPAKVTVGNAEPGVQDVNPRQHWIPAFAGMTKVSYFIGPEQYFPTDRVTSTRSVA